MIRSMTGFGRASAEIDGVAIAVELRTVNHRHLDVSVRLPRNLAALEPRARKAAQGGFLRGKVDATVQLAGNGPGRSTLEVDRTLSRAYLAAAKAMVPGAATLTAAELLALPGVARVVEEGFDEEACAAPLVDAVARAAAAADAMRETEGAAIDADLRRRLLAIEALAAEVEARADEVVQQAKDRLRRRAEQLQEETGLLDRARLHQEVVLAADRMDVTEEVVRLRSHVAQFRSTLDEAGRQEPVGRRLDFLVQEMVREANTIGSKAGDAAVAHRSVDLKTELERIREQVQNVE